MQLHAPRVTVLKVCIFGQRSLSGFFKFLPPVGSVASVGHMVGDGDSTATQAWLINAACMPVPTDQCGCAPCRHGNPLAK